MDEGLLTWTPVPGEPYGDIQAPYRGFMFTIMRSGAAGDHAKAYVQRMADRHLRFKPRDRLTRWTTLGVAKAACEDYAAGLSKPLMELIDEYSALTIGGQTPALRTEIKRRIAELEGR